MNAEAGDDHSCQDAHIESGVLLSRQGVCLSRIEAGVDRVLMKVSEFAIDKKARDDIAQLKASRDRAIDCWANAWTG